MGGMESATRRDRREERWQKRAEQARDAFGLVLILVLITYVLASVLDDKGWSAVPIMVTATLTAIVGLTSAHSKRTLVRRAIVAAVLAVLLATAGAIVGGRLCLNLATFIVIALLIISMGAVLQRVVTAGSVSSRTILGAISVYASLGLVFTYAYALVDRLEDGAFFGPEVTIESGDILFFSYTTLTTTGYGDLVPAGQVGRMLSRLEMMVGQIFLVTLVAGLVSLWRPGEGILKRRERRSQSS
jgi:hypothetical protein